MSDRPREMQADWFIREVKRCREIGMPLGCCNYWPECSHVLVWMEDRAALGVEGEQEKPSHED